MQTIRELINKLKWDKKENPAEYVFYYLDKKELLPLQFKDIKRLDGTFLVVGDDETYIPMHRIRRVEKKGRLIFER
ncbi:MAG: DUF504 domain-containing protein [Candidatus Woesearchaeota archaeon]